MAMEPQAQSGALIAAWVGHHIHPSIAHPEAIAADRDAPSPAAWASSS
jgi:hypothetical protein